MAVVRGEAPLGVRDGTLTVQVASAAWAQELSLLGPEILGRLAENGVRARETDAATALADAMFNAPPPIENTP